MDKDVDAVTSFDPVATTATLTTVVASSASVTLATNNVARLGVIIFNNSTNALYLAFAATASTSAFTAKVGSGSYWEDPAFRYTNIITGIWDGTDGDAQVTVVTA